MTPLVEFPNVVLVVTGRLRTALAANGYPGVRVADTYEGDGLEVWVQRDGGRVLDVAREVARIRVNVFAPGPTSGPVDDLARRVSTLMRAAADGAPIQKVTQTTGPTSVQDTMPRRLLNFELIVRGTPLSPA